MCPNRDQAWFDSFWVSQYLLPSKYVSASSGKASIGHCSASVATISGWPLSAMMNSLWISNRPVGGYQAGANISKRILEIARLHTFGENSILSSHKRSDRQEG